MKFTVIGGMNLDILGVPLQNFNLRDSNAGRVVFSPGGVAHNIAANLAKLGGQVNLITAISRDSYAQILRQSCISAGVSLSGSVTVDQPTSVYLCIHDDSGDMVAAINDMRIMESLTPAHIERVLPQIKKSSICILDTNIPEETLSYVTAHTQIPLLLDPVSCTKGMRAISALPRIFAIKPNLTEALALSGQGSPDDAASWFLDKGVKRVFISLGADGVYFADISNRGVHPAIPVRRNARTGAGDAMCAGIALALARGLDTSECALEGCRCAAEHLANTFQEG